jgi:hypothetical protein
MRTTALARFSARIADTDNNQPSDYHLEKTTLRFPGVPQ